jgi:hypothetical protein
MAAVSALSPRSTLTLAMSAAGIAPPLSGRRTEAGNGAAAVKLCFTAATSCLTLGSRRSRQRWGPDFLHKKQALGIWVAMTCF